MSLKAVVANVLVSVDKMLGFNFCLYKGVSGKNLHLLNLNCFSLHINGYLILKIRKICTTIHKLFPQILFSGLNMRSITSAGTSLGRMVSENTVN